MSSLVSIVVPAFNNAQYLADTIRSILDQTYTNLEVIIADHASADRTFEVMRTFESDPRVVLLRTEAGGGALRNWNRVSEAASGEYIKLVCGDDLIYPEIVELQVRALAAAPEAVIAASSRDIVDSRGGTVIKNRGLGGLTGVVAGHRVIRRTVSAGTNLCGEPGCVLFRRDVLKQIGLWDSQNPYLIDEATYVRALLVGDLAVVPGPLAAFRLSDSQWSARLIKEQADQAVAFHNRLRQERPDVVRARDLVIGNARVRLTARGRRLAYAYLGLRAQRVATTGSPRV